MKTDHNAVVIALLAEISSRLSSLEGKVADNNTLSHKRAVKARQQARYRARRTGVANVDATGANVDTTSANVDTTTKKEKGEKEISPQTPYIEKEGKKKEKLSLCHARAHEGGSLPKTDKLVEACRLHGEETPPHPTLDEVIEWSKIHNPQRYTESLIREWYEKCEICGWRDKDGNPIRNWGGNLYMWREYYESDKRKADPDRIPDARVAAQKRNIVHADNWRGTKPENLQHVF